MRKLWSILLVLTMVLAAAVPALAGEKKRKPHEEFGDLDDAGWALPFVAEMRAKGLMKGVGVGKFAPHGTLSRAQAITVAIRLMNLEDQARALAPVPDDRLPFADRERIPGWAQPYVAVAVEKNILPVTEDGLLRADEPATRLWVSVLLVRALGFDAEAQAKMTAALPFQDAHLIPARLVGYVAAAVDHGLVRGYDNGTFRPNKPVTRAEAAVLLSRTDGQMAELGRLRPGNLVATLLAVDAAKGTLVVRSGQAERTIAVAENAAIFAGGKEATLADLSPGARVTLVIGADGQAVVVAVKERAAGEEERELKGTIAALAAPGAQPDSGLISLKLASGGEKTFPLAPDVAVSGPKHVAMTLPDLKVGDRVEVKLVAGVVIRIQVEERAAKAESDGLRGTVTAVAAATETALARLTLQAATGEVTLPVAPGAEIRLGDQSLTLADLKAGDPVEVKVVAGVIIRIRKLEVGD